jgi:hypothetical protein
MLLYQCWTLNTNHLSQKVHKWFNQFQWHNQCITRPWCKKKRNKEGNSSNSYSRKCLYQWICSSSRCQFNSKTSMCQKPTKAEWFLKTDRQQILTNLLHPSEGIKISLILMKKLNSIPWVILWGTSPFKPLIRISQRGPERRRRSQFSVLTKIRNSHWKMKRMK